ncbi:MULTISPECIES: GntR family transcriptional regulator [unclassified Streptomyces]|uniref:GntR family transcriptional regulator n=1 Tax=unclassified Streptomyces TaxID=2593676 RepID=UPI001BE75B0A|nr:MULTISPECIES: GntR family transcriptional regulator [unclassified Streptomyces]MBT2405669.1 GntR family transcriptional regulator [Streptomyces sp. ISL-21]MBT2459161.1 GntR family transcriptional regulator [Streptomyces sp. ISL-86]MBT2610014.1 GntR family transcriptional regulator [Streptomyces sp. ISL-87]
MTLPSPDEEALDRRSLHVRIAADLRDEIMSGDLAPGAKLPSTTHLKARFDASSATVQKALQLLKDERLVVGRAGAAVTVRENRQRTIRPAGSLTTAAAEAPYPWLADAAEQGTSAHSTLIEVGEVAPPADVAAVLGLQSGELTLLRRQLLHINDAPAELVSSYYPLTIAQGTPLAEARKIKGGTPTLLTRLGYPPRLSVDRVSARVPTQEQCRALRLPSDLPVLRTLRTVLSDDERPVEATVMVKAGHLYELRYEFTPEA